MPLACSRRLHKGDSYTGRASARRTHATGTTWGLAEPGGGGARRPLEPVERGEGLGRGGKEHGRRNREVREVGIGYSHQLGSHKKGIVFKGVASILSI